MDNIPCLFLYDTQGTLPFVVRRRGWPEEAALLITDVQPRHSRSGWFGEVTGFALKRRSEDEYWGTEEEPISPSSSGSYQWSLVPEEQYLPEWAAIVARHPPERRPLPTSVEAWIKGAALTDTVTFGKHKGQTFEAVLADDPRYIEWSIGQGAVRFSDASMVEVAGAIHRLRGDGR